MPEVEFPKLRPHPFCASGDTPVRCGTGSAAYVELCVTSNFTFLTGASHPEEYVYAAVEQGHHAIALADLHTLAGVVRAHVAAKNADLQFVPGVRLQPADLESISLNVYPTDRAAYARLCRMLTLGKRRAEKGQCRLTFDDLAGHATGLLAIALPDRGARGALEASLVRLREVFDDDRLSLAACRRYDADDDDELRRIAETSGRLGLPLVATNDVHHHVPERRPLQDVLTCIRAGCTVSQAGFRLHANAERHLKRPAEMQRLFRFMPQALQRTLAIAERTRGFQLSQLRYEYPSEVVPPGTTPMRHLEHLTWQGACEHFPGGIPENIRRQLEHELRLIDELDYASYFLTVHDLVVFARGRGILCQGRGAAANSAVCYYLGVTAVDPTRIDLLFERFISKERDEPPDIDIDFEHERREEVIQYIYAKYGRDRAALTAEVISYRRRSAVRAVGKALGFSLDTLNRVAKNIEWWHEGATDAARWAEAGINPNDETCRHLVRLASELAGFPRHLSQHVGGFVISESPLCELVPIENARMENRTVIEWDKDDIDALGLLKVDVLGLGMLSAIRRCLAMVNHRHGSHLTLNNVPAEDAKTYEMIQRADTVGVFQIESRAQMSMLPRLKPARFYDLVIEVAIVRPGPIQGDMVHPFLRRRNGLEAVDYIHPSIEPVLKKTLGVPLFQEQCMAIAMRGAGFTAGEADQLRRSMAAWKRKGDQIARFGEKLIHGMIANGIPEEFAQRCFKQICGFAEYGFPESHAASFALLAYVSAWLKRHHPAELTAALLNSQPMGFYAPAQLIRDAREHGIEVRPPDVNHSDWDCTIEKGGALRLGFRLISGLSEADALKIRAAVARHGSFSSVLSLWRVSGARVSTLQRMAAGDAFGSLGLSRQQALWQTRRLRDECLPLFDRPDAAREPADRVPLPPFSAMQEVWRDYSTVGLSLRTPPIAFLLDELCRQGVVPCGDLRDPSASPNGEWVAVAGLVITRQRPATAEGVTFLTLEDETGIANIVVWRRIYQRYRRVAGGTMLIVRGRVQRESEVVHVIASSMRRPAATQRSDMDTLASVSRNFH